MADTGVETGFTGKSAAITGAASGIGRAIALALAAEGLARAVLIDRDAAGLDQLTEELRASGVQVLPLALDISDGDAMASAHAEANAFTAGRLDMIFAAAGILGPAVPVVECSEADWDSLQRINVRGTWLTLRHLLPLMRPAGGAIVTLASGAGMVGSADLGPYGVSKAAVIGLTRALAVQHAAEGIRVNCLCPGPIETPMLEQNLALEGAAALDARRARFMGRIPMGRFGRAEEVAQAALFLAGARSAYTTGAILPIDGGRLA